MLNRHCLLFLGLTLFSCFESGLYAQTLSNFDFEESYPNDFIPKHWHLYDVSGTGINFSLDSTEFFEGKYSLKIELKRLGHARLDCFLPSSKIKGHSLNLSLKVKGKGHLKIKAILQTKGRKQIMDCAQETILLNNQEGWKQLNIPITFSKPPEGFSFRIKIEGQGVAWIDDMKIALDGKLWKENPSTIQEPTQDEINWLKSQVLPITLDRFLDERTSEELKSMFSNADIVGLGEITHGSGSVFTLKKEIIQFLVQEIGFQAILEETPLPESKHLRNFVLGRAKNIPFERAVECWNLYADEHFETLNWLKKYNEAAKQKVDYLGFDLSINLKGLDEIEEEVKSIHPEDPIINTILTLKKGIFFTRNRSQETCYDPELSHEQDKYIEDSFLAVERWIQQNIQEERDENWLLLNLNNAKQLYRVYQEGILRDNFLAENVDIILRSRKNIKRVIVSGHNAHVSNSRVAMGGQLKDRYSEKYISVGFAFHEGEYTAFGARGLNSYVAQTSYPSTFEYFFHLTGLDAFILDLRTIDPSHPKASWLYKVLNFRKTGSVKTFGDFSPLSLMNEFDILIFINKSSGSKLKSF